MKLTMSAAAAHAKVSTNTIRAWIRRGLPAHRADSGEWEIEVEDLDAWAQQATAPNDDEPEESAKAAIDRERSRKLAAEADIAEMDAAQRRGELISIAIVAKDRAESIARARGVLIAMETKLAPLCAAETDVLIVRSIIGAEVRRALSELARSGLSRGDGGDGPDMDAAA